MKNLFVEKWSLDDTEFHKWHMKNKLNLWNVGREHVGTYEEVVDWCENFEKSFGKPVAFNVCDYGFNPESPNCRFEILAYEICNEAREDEEWLQMLWDEDDRQFAH